MKERHIIGLLALIMAVLSLASCSEEDNTVVEYPDWQATNEQYYDNLFATARQKEASGDKSWRTYMLWSLDSATATHSYDHIVVHVLSESGETVSPYISDTVRVHYKGSLLPSATYKTGYVFDQSYKGDSFNAATAVPVKFGVSEMVSGFTTALLHMHLGDRWEVYIPYQLAYGEDGQGAIPGYSMLKFEIDLVGIYRSGSTIPDWKAKPNSWIMWNGQ